MNIRGQINWWQLLIVILSGLVTGMIAAGQYLVTNKAELDAIFGTFLAGAVISGITGVMAMLSGKPAKEIAEDIAEDVAETLSRKGANDAESSHS